MDQAQLSPFFSKLPPEVRNLVYRQLLVTPDRITGHLKYYRQEAETRSYKDGRKHLGHRSHGIADLSHDL